MKQKNKKTHKRQHAAHGMDTTQPKSLYEAMGFDVKEKLNDNPKEFDERLKKISLNEMHTLAIELGVKPIYDRARMQKILSERYRETCNKSYAGVYEVKTVELDKDARKKLEEYAKRFA